MNMRRFVLLNLAVVTSVCFADAPTITGVTAQQRYPWNGKVDISYTVTGNIAAEAKERGLLTSLKVTATDRDANTTYTATSLSGDRSLAAGTHAIVWDMDAQGLSFKSSNVVFSVACEATPALYCVIDLSAGANASSYPVTYQAAPPSGGFNVDTYKTTKLVLRRITQGSFKMCGSYNVTLSKPFYVGIFEMTQKQYTLIMGENPSRYKGDKRPVDQMSYAMIRGSSNGTKWPLSSTVDLTSFVGKFQARTGLSFDLPTEAQWEYACRAGTTTSYNNGGNTVSDLKKLGRYEGNNTDGKGGFSYYHTVVGSYEANAWGLYDMHGNVWERCLDAYGTLSSNVVDPVGGNETNGRIIRGGCFGSDESSCTSSSRGNTPYSGTVFTTYGDGCGFRIARTLSRVDVAGDLCAGSSIQSIVDLTSGTRTAAVSETIRYSTGWVSGATANAVAVVDVDGEQLSAASGNGSVEWTPMSNGIYTLIHKVMSGDTQIGDTLTATFIVEGLNPDAPIISPTDGTTFDGSLSVSISCPTDGATIHYTTNGSEPTAESPVYRRFRIYGKTTVKAVAEKDGLLSDIVVAHYALGRCVDPVISLADGMVFEHSNQEVSIDWAGTDGVLCYTLDGSEPTAESFAYNGPFTISESTIVKAKVFSDDFFDSAVVTASLTRVWANVATPVIDAATSFTGSKTKVTLSCDTDGALVRYTLNGNEPNSHSTKYMGPFYVTESCTVKAYATLADYLASAVATQAIEKVWNIGDTMGKPNHGFTTSGSGGGTGWTRVVDATAPDGEAMKSGAITHNQSSVLSTTVMGPGTLSFAWRTSCEEDEFHEWDHAEFVVDGTARLVLDGVNSWQDASVAIVGNGEHTVEWRYVKDDVESEGEDAAWVASYQWESAWTATRTTDVPVPYVWLMQHDPDVVDEYEAYEAAAKGKAANGRMSREECYVVGLDPEVATNDFKITSFPLKADGTPDLEHIVFDPPQARWNVPATYKVKGAANLSDTDWPEVTEGNKGLFRFFKVEVVLP